MASRTLHTRENTVGSESILAELLRREEDLNLTLGVFNDLSRVRSQRRGIMAVRPLKVWEPL